MRESVTMLGASSSGLQKGCCKTLILSGQWDGSSRFEAVPRKAAIGMYDLVDASKANPGYLDANSQAATQHEHYLRNWAQQHKLPVKIFKTEGLARCLMVRKHLEHLRLNIQCVEDLSMCPVQLGWADITEWRASKDPCRFLAKNKGLAHMLNAMPLRSSELDSS